MKSFYITVTQIYSEDILFEKAEGGFKGRKG